jgi:segregation and condensation protein A
VDDDTAPSQDSVQLQLHGYEGPLELLLELARGQRVDLARISVTALVDQFVTAVTAMQRRDLARATEWLVMAAWLTWLKSRLMLPQGLEEAKQGSEAGQVLIDRLAELDRIRSIATWLEAQPQLGRDMFERGHGYTQMGPVVAADLAGLFQACLSVLQKSEHGGPDVYIPPRLPFWTPAQARRRLLAMLEGLPEGGELLGFLPPLRKDAANPALRVRGAIAGTLIAALELAKEGLAELRQTEAFGKIGILAGSITNLSQEPGG